MPRLPYARQVLAESMRLFPPAWIIGRRALEDLPLQFHDPERFDPDRFTSEAVAERPRYAYFPFGGGPRVCLGENFAWLEATLLLATVIQRWRLASVAGHPVEPQPLVTLRPRYGLKMTVHERGATVD